MSTATAPPRSAGDGAKTKAGDRLFKSVAGLAASTITIVIGLIAIFLLVKAIPALRANHANFFTSAQFNTVDSSKLAFGIRDLFMVTLLSSIWAMALAVFLTQYAPPRLSRPFGAIVDLLAAVPSIVFGLWGIFVLAPQLEPTESLLNRELGWLFLFKAGDVSLAGGGNIFTAGVVLAVMVLPIITSVSREVFRQTPTSHTEAAQALGATKWEVVRMTVLPYGRSGAVAASMLGLGRALGETVAVLIILRASASAGHWSLFDGGYTFASKIASAASEFSDPLPTGAYISAGFVLFVLTFVVNAVARGIVGRGIKNKIAATFFMVSFGIALVPLIWVLWVVVERGWYAITRHGWWSHSLRGVLPEQFSGGVYHALYGTVVQAAVAAIIAVPLGFMTAVYLAEYRSSRLAKFTTFMVDVLAGLPSIVAALFIFSLWIATIGFEQSAFAVSLALVLLMLPVVVRSSEEMLRLVPQDLREASYALGIPKWKTIMRIVVPVAMPGIITGVLLSIARVMGETAPVLVLVGYSRSINFDIFNGNMASLPLLIYSELNNPEHAGFLRVWGAALTLIIVVAVVYLVAALANRLIAIRRR